MKKLSKQTTSIALLFLINCFLYPLVYFLLALRGFDAILIVYAALIAVIAIAYFIYNRGFAGKNATPEMLPDTMTAEEKKAFIEEGKRRFSASRWVLAILFPLILTIAIDVINLFLIPMIKELFS